MLLPVRNLIHQKQERKNNCISTCLSIVTGIPEHLISEEISHDGYEEPFSIFSAIRFLTREGIYVEKVNCISGIPLVEEGIYLITCASSISPKSAHMIVGSVYGGYMNIIDPADDLLCEKIYSSVDHETKNIPCFEYYLLTDCLL